MVELLASTAVTSIVTILASLFGALSGYFVSRSKDQNVVGLADFKDQVMSAYYNSINKSAINPELKIGLILTKSRTTEIGMRTRATQTQLSQETRTV